MNALTLRARELPAEAQPTFLLGTTPYHSLEDSDRPMQRSTKTGHLRRLPLALFLELHRPRLRTNRTTRKSPVARTTTSSVTRLS